MKTFREGLPQSVVGWIAFAFAIAALATVLKSAVPRVEPPVVFGAWNVVHPVTRGERLAVEVEINVLRRCRALVNWLLVAPDGSLAWRYDSTVGYTEVGARTITVRPDVPLPETLADGDYVLTVHRRDQCADGEHQHAPYVVPVRVP